MLRWVSAQDAEVMISNRPAVSHVRFYDPRMAQDLVGASGKTTVNKELASGESRGGRRGCLFLSHLGG